MVGSSAIGIRSQSSSRCDGVGEGGRGDKGVEQGGGWSSTWTTTDVTSQAGARDDVVISCLSFLLQRFLGGSSVAVVVAGAKGVHGCWWRGHDCSCGTGAWPRVAMEEADG